ncbi:hypothetical protein D6D04_10800 [Aureobasidium pullulans]|nr:hypothetical protein D6D04_10800 [Aureobasidium pullulans]
MSSKTASDVDSDRSDANDKETDLKAITEREMWLKSYGMMPHTDPGDLAYHKIDGRKLEFHKAAGEEGKVFPPHEERPGALSDLFKQHLADCKALCLTSMDTGGARDQIVHALKTHCIEKVVVLGTSSLFDCFAEYENWVFEIGFSLAIFQLVEQWAKRNNTRLPKLIFQDPGYCSADHRLLTDLGAKVVEHPEAFTDHIDSKTLVFARHLLHDVSIYSLLPASPAVCLMTKVEMSVEGVEHFRGCKEFDPDFDTSGVAKTFLTDRKQVELSEVLIPRCRDGSTWAPYNFVDGMWLYWMTCDKGMGS